MGLTSVLLQGRPRSVEPVVGMAKEPGITLHKGNSLRQPET
jgi:hypothetical protein